MGEVRVWLDGAIMFNEPDEEDEQWGCCLLTVRGKDHDLDAKTMREFGEALIRAADQIEGIMTKEKFESLSPAVRGYTVYMAGDRDDQPNVPNESNPYPKGSENHSQWAHGQDLAVQEVQDCP